MAKNSFKLLNAEAPSRRSSLLSLKADLSRLKASNPTYDVDSVKAFLSSFWDENTFYETPRYDVAFKAKLKDEFDKRILAFREKYPFLVEQELSYSDKYWVSQGGKIPWSQTRGNTLKYVTLTEGRLIEHLLPNDTERELIIEYLLSRVTKQSVEPLRRTTLLETYRGAKRSNSGIWLWTDRRPPAVRYRALNDALAAPHSWDPVVRGTRRMRGKDRDIFMDTFPNLLRYNRLGRPFHDAFKELGHAAWSGHFEAERVLYAFCDKHPNFTSFEFDAKSMDQSMSAENVKYALDILGEVIDFSSMKAEFYQMVDEIFNIELLTPEGLWVGPKKLLSGLGPTNDFETYLLLVAFLGFLARYSVDERSEPMILHPFEMKVVGDDIVILVPNHIHMVWDTRQLIWVDPIQAMIDTATAYGLVAEPSKQGHRFNEFYFCRHYFNPLLPKYKDKHGFTHAGSAYSLVLAANNWITPEELKHPNWVDYQYVIFTQQFDGLRFHPLWKWILSRLYEMNLIPLGQLTEEAKAAYRASGADWVFNLFGVDGTLDGSPTDQYITGKRLSSQPK